LTCAYSCLLLTFWQELTPWAQFVINFSWLSEASRSALGRKINLLRPVSITAARCVAWNATQRNAQP